MQCDDYDGRALPITDRLACGGALRASLSYSCAIPITSPELHNSAWPTREYFVQRSRGVLPDVKRNSSFIIPGISGLKIAVVRTSD